MAETLARQFEAAATTTGAAADVRPRRLLHVLPSFAVGGIQVRLARLVNAFGRRYQHTIVSLDGNALCRDRLDTDLDVTIVAGPPRGQALLPRLLASRAFVRRTAPDLLLTYNWGAIEWALANRAFGLARHVHFEDGFGPDEVDQQLPRRIRMRRWALAGADQIIVPSRRLAAIALNDWRLDATRLRHIPNGIDVDAFHAGQRREDAPFFARDPDEVIVGTVAPLRREKNLARLVRAFAALPPTSRARLVIAGDGGERAALEALARDLGLADRILFLGPVAAPERVLASFDVFALSSDTEQMPLTILEAMAASLPVAAIDVGDVRHMLAPTNRILVAAREDETGFAAALGRLVHDAALRRDLGQRNEAYVRETYPWRRMAEAYDRVFTDA
jgi:glycosyltransferase involved in cell wall biosynthesis